MPLNAPSFIQLHHLSKIIRNGDSELTILRDVNLTIKTGETLAITGTSGSGKTTLLTLLAGLDLPTGGDIYFLKHHLNQLDEEKRATLRGQYLGFIFQSFQLLPSLTALENVMLPLEIQYISPVEAKSRAKEWLNRVGLDKRLQHYPSELSGGEQQRVAIARAFVNQPSLILADEMTGNLDTHTGQMVMDVLFSLNQDQNTTLVLVTHDENLTKRCQSHYRIKEGCLECF